jgi:hypothetical protein
MSVIESMRPCHRCRGQTQPVYRQNIARNVALPAGFGRLVSRVAFVIALAQLVDQIFKAGGSLQRLGLQIASQPLADSIANRSAGGAIECLAGVVGSAAHRWFRPDVRWVTQHQVAVIKNVSRPRNIACPLVKRRIAGFRPDRKSPGAGAAGALWRLDRSIEVNSSG